MTFLPPPSHGCYDTRTRVHGEGAWRRRQEFTDALRNNEPVEFDGKRYYVASINVQFRQFSPICEIELIRDHSYPGTYVAPARGGLWMHAV